LAAEWAGFTTVGQCEWADYPTKVLEKHWPDVPRWKDIRTLTGDSFYERTGLRTVDIISGGFPCQPFSVAGKQKGKEDNRYLWPEMLRVIRELHPDYIIGENVPGILHIAADDVCKDMEHEGYEVGIFNYEAAAVGAKHRRERFFFVAYTRGGGFSKQDICTQQSWRAETISTSESCSNRGTSKVYEDVADPDIERKLQLQRPVEIIGRRISNCSENVANTKSIGRWSWEKSEQSERDSARKCTSDSSVTLPDTNNTPPTRQREYSGEIHARSESKGFSVGSGSNWWAVEPNVGRVASGVPNRVDRLKCLGNAVVPQQAYPIFKAIAEIERQGVCNPSNSPRTAR
jgi:DNA (cytosine-5)-methyltransferase 1